MRRLLLSIIVLSFVLACKEKPKNPVAEYGDAMIDAYKRGQQAGETANLDAVKKTIQAYHAANDKYPESLDEIKGLLRTEIDISKYDYDPQTGKVAIKSN